jgi:acyl-CoA reductase-like NAD-dependent aldehyde dehydrogenase
MPGGIRSVFGPHNCHERPPDARSPVRRHVAPTVRSVADAGAPASRAAVRSTAGNWFSTGGTRCGGDPASGFFLEPAVGADLRQDDEAIQNEIFGQ